LPANGDTSSDEGLINIVATFKSEINENSKDNITEITDSMIASFAEEATYT
jgi:hypothetical protein